MSDGGVAGVNFWGLLKTALIEGSSFSSGQLDI
jgi:hypothetical protein